MSREAAIQEIIDRETRAWNTKDVALLLSVFHPDMVWPWPATYTSIDPVDWHLVVGRDARASMIIGLGAPARSTRSSTAIGR